MGWRKLSRNSADQRVILDYAIEAFAANPDKGVLLLTFRVVRFFSFQVVHLYYAVWNSLKGVARKRVPHGAARNQAACCNGGAAKSINWPRSL